VSGSALGFVWLPATGRLVSRLGAVRLRRCVFPGRSRSVLAPLVSSFQVRVN